MSPSGVPWTAEQTKGLLPNRETVCWWGCQNKAPGDLTASQLLTIFQVISFLPTVTECQHRAAHKHKRKTWLLVGLVMLLDAGLTHSWHHILWLLKLSNNGHNGCWVPSYTWTNCWFLQASPHSILTISIKNTFLLTASAHTCVTPERGVKAWGLMAFMAHKS